MKTTIFLSLDETADLEGEEDQRDWWYTYEGTGVPVPNVGDTVGVYRWVGLRGHMTAARGDGLELESTDYRVVSRKIDYSPDDVSVVLVVRPDYD